MPLGRRVALPGRGQTFVREAGDATKPTLLLVHGWMASAAMNWATVFEPLEKDFHVLAPDLRGHGRGPRSARPFRLEDCADDLAAMLDVLGTSPVVVVGYSMGGLVAQLLWQRHPEHVAGLVLCSTTRVFAMGQRERYLLVALMTYAAGTVRLTRAATAGYRAARQLGVRRRERPETLRKWATTELRRHDMRQVLEAGPAACRFDSSAWVGDIDVPTAVLVTTRDRAIEPDIQRALASAIGGASVHEVADDHTAFLHAEFPPVLLGACREVAERASC